MNKLFIGVMLVLSMSNIGCSMCEKKPSHQAKINACLSDPACVNQVRTMAGAPSLLPGAQPYMVNGVPIINGQVLANQQPVVGSGAPAVLPYPGSGIAARSVSNADIQSRQQRIAAALQAADRADVPVGRPTALDSDAGLLTQQQQVSPQSYTSTEPEGSGGVR